MPTNIENKIRAILLPTDDKEGWNESIKSLNRDEALPVLIRMMRDPQENSKTRKLAMLALGIMEDQRALPAIAQVLKSGDPDMRAWAAYSLGQFGSLGNETMQSLVQALNDDNYLVRELSAKTLGNQKYAEALPALEHMKDADSEETNKKIAKLAIDNILGIA